MSGIKHKSQILKLNNSLEFIRNTKKSIGRGKKLVFRPNKKIPLPYINGYRSSKNSFLVEISFKKYLPTHSLFPNFSVTLTL